MVFSPPSEWLVFNPVDGYRVQTFWHIKPKERQSDLKIKTAYAVHRKKFYLTGRLHIKPFRLQGTGITFFGGRYMYQVNEPFRKNETLFSLINLLQEENPLFFRDTWHGGTQFEKFFRNTRMALAFEWMDRKYPTTRSFSHLQFAENQPSGTFPGNDRSFLTTLNISLGKNWAIRYRQGIPEIGGSHANFSQIEINAHLYRKIKGSEWKASAYTGTFFHTKSIHYNDYYHFPTRGTLKAFNPVEQTYRLMNYYELSSAKGYGRLHIQAQFYRLLLPKRWRGHDGMIRENLFFNAAYSDFGKIFLEGGYTLDSLLGFLRAEVVMGRVGGAWVGPRFILGPATK